ncbi:hypothetical protein [Xanthomonas sp. WHRI 7064]
MLTLIVLLSHGLSYWITFLVPDGAAATINGTPGRIESLAALLASFAFTMLGFLAAVLALFGIMSGSSLLARYKRHGHLDTLLLVIGLTMVELVATFATSVALYFHPLTDNYSKFLAWLVTTNSVMLLVSTLPVVMLVKGTLDSIRHG